MDLQIFWNFGIPGKCSVKCSLWSPLTQASLAGTYTPLWPSLSSLPVARSVEGYCCPYYIPFEIMYPCCFVLYLLSHLFISWLLVICVPHIASLWLTVIVPLTLRLTTFELIILPPLRLLRPVRHRTKAEPYFRCLPKIVLLILWHVF
jgi:hypothetical protein